MKGTAAV